VQRSVSDYRQPVISLAVLRQRLAAVPAPVQAIALALVSSAAFTVMHTLIRGMTREMHPFEVAFFRVFLGFFVLLPLMLRTRFGVLKTPNLGKHAVRGVLNAGAMLCFFTGLSMTPLAEATALSFTAPLFATVLAIFMLGEKVRIRRGTAILVGFAGTLVILRPGMIEPGLGPILVICSALIWSFALMLIKVMTRTDSSITITAMASVMVTPYAAVAAAFVWQWPTLEQLGVLVTIAAIGTVAQTGMNQALKLGDTSVVLPVEFTRLIWAAALGFSIFGEVPDTYTWIGGGIIFASTTYIGLREARLARERRRAQTPVDPAGASGDKTG
jgi:drug/metabolite transporter (DMT)-like permease